MYSKAETACRLMYEETANENLRVGLATVLNHASSMSAKVEAFHLVCGIACPMMPTRLAPADIERRLRLTLEENLETTRASGAVISVADIGDVTNSLEVLIVEPINCYNEVEVADGIADQLVTNLGHALEAGLDIESIFREVMLSNMTKVPADGVPLVNGVTPGYRGPFTSGSDRDEDHSGEPGYRPDAPVGKILKPESFVPADIGPLMGQPSRFATEE